MRLLLGTATLGGFLAGGLTVQALDPPDPPSTLCHTVYIGPPDGDHGLDANWPDGFPCIRDWRALPMGSAAAPRP